MAPRCVTAMTIAFPRGEAPCHVAGSYDRRRGYDPGRIEIRTSRRTCSHVHAAGEQLGCDDQELEGVSWVAEPCFDICFLLTGQLEALTPGGRFIFRGSDTHHNCDKYATALVFFGWAIDQGEWLLQTLACGPRCGDAGTSRGPDAPGRGATRFAGGPPSGSSRRTRPGRGVVIRVLAAVFIIRVAGQGRG